MTLHRAAPVGTTMQGQQVIRRAQKGVEPTQNVRIVRGRCLRHQIRPRYPQQVRHSRLCTVTQLKVRRLDGYRVVVVHQPYDRIDYYE